MPRASQAYWRLVRTLQLPLDYLRATVDDRRQAAERRRHLALGALVEAYRAPHPSRRHT